MIRRLDRYELLEQVGSGGMAVVYRGRDTALDREVAVKILHPHLAARPESRARFSREARAVARLSHPNVVEIFDYAGDAALESYIVTEFVRGRTLRAFADEEGIAYPEVAALIVRALADALVHAHAAGVIHRDLKPENVLVLEAGGRRAVKLVDFGIARILSSDEKMTLTGALVGSPNHMAPEIIAGEEADARSDVFSLGTLLYWLSTGKMPFAAPNPTATLRRIIEGDYTEARTLAPVLSDTLSAVIAHAMASERARRTPSAAALRDELDAALASAGLTDPPAELQAFLAAPHRYKAELRPRLVSYALAASDRALAHGETARAMRLLDHVLALQPGDAEVTARLDRIARAARRRRRLRLAGGGAALALALAGLAGVVQSWSWPRVRRPAAPPPAPVPTPERAPAPPTAAAPVAAPAPAPVTAAPAPATPAPASAIQAPPKRPARPTAVARPAQRPAPGTATAPAAPARAALEVSVSPYAQRALLDGVEVARGEGRVTFHLTPGVPHRIQIEHACCFPFVKEFGPGEPIPSQLKERLAPRPARLRVEGDPQLLVYVQDRLVGSAGDSQRAPLEVAVPPTGDSPYEGPASLRLEAPGRPALRATVRLRAGADVTFVAPAAPARATASEAGP